MAGTKEILDRIGSIRETLKVTNAMYLISSSKIRKAKKKMTDVQAYYDAICSTIGEALATAPDIEHKYLENGRDDAEDVRRAYLVITADKGLAGAFNLNVIKLAETELDAHPDSELFVVGQVGCHHFDRKGIKHDEDFIYSAQDPTMQRARYISADLLDGFEKGHYGEIYVIYTRMKNALSSEAVMTKLMPLSKDAFRPGSEKYVGEESFYPNAAAVFSQIAPLTMQGVIFTALTESYCAELNDRMTAMSSATKNAEKAIQELELEYNRMRQGSITQEITEIIAGSRAQKR